MKKDQTKVEEVRNPAQEELKERAEQVGKLVQPGWLKVPEGSHGHERGHGLSSTREFIHRGHKVSVKTTYEIKIDGEPYAGHINVDDEGRIRCHAIPYETYPSAVDFVKQLIDQYPRSFSAPSGERGES